jgi:hypothetical protein
MIKIEFPADRADIALAFSVALQQLAGGTAAAHISLAERLQQQHELDHKHVGGAPGTTTGHAEVVQTVAGQVDTQTGELVEDELPATINDLGRRDLKGVAFDERYCANAQDPFYSSGKEKGQWKAKRGLAAGVYENWYAGQLATSAPAATDEDSDLTPIVQTGAAFGAVPSTLAPAPQTAGEFMAWVAEKQTAGKLSQDAINNAYANLGVRVQDLFPPTPEHVVANNVRALHQHLAQAAGA